VYEERPAIPAFTGVAEISKLALMFTLWSRIESFLYDEIGLADQRGNARKRILNRTLPIVGDHYKLIDYSERHEGNSMEYSICRSERLVKFAETHLVPAINGMFGKSTNNANSQKSASPKMPVSKTKTQAKSRTSAARKNTGAKSTVIKSWFGGSLVPASYPQMNSHHGDGTVLVSRFATYWLESASGQGRIRITVPLQFYLASWDVGALERELERLGVKLKPKPRKKPLPKPGTVISG